MKELILKNFEIRFFKTSKKEWDFTKQINFLIAGVRFQSHLLLLEKIYAIFNFPPALFEKILT